MKQNGLPTEIRSLTGIRFAAAAWVVGFHFSGKAASLCPSLAPVLRLFAHGHLAVPFFFILSGFILSHVYFPKYSLGQHGNFIWLRLARLWPVHLATILALLAYVSLSAFVRGSHVSDESYALSALPLDLAMARTWFEPKMLWNFPAWSIHCEWFAYVVLFPLCFILFSRVRRPLYLALTVCLLLTAQIHLAVLFPGFLGSIVFLFIAGSALYRLRVLTTGAHGAAIGIAAVSLFALGSYTNNESVFHLSFACLVLGLSYGRCWLSRVFSGRLMVYGGTISFSLYMTHGVVHKFGSEVIKIIAPKGEIAGASIISFMIAAALVIAVLTNRFIEVPANLWLKRYMQKNAGSIAKRQVSLYAVEQGQCFYPAKN